MTQSTARIDLDLVVIGGGIAGLWLLNRAVAAGRRAILLEREALGAGQTIHAQGIIHGGTKYTLGGALTASSEAIAHAPGRWRDCLGGLGEPDLSCVPVLSEATYLWSTGSLGSRMTALLASHGLRSRVAGVTDPPPIFAGEGFRGSLYRVDEMVLDVPALLNALARPVSHLLFKRDASELTFSRQAQCVEIRDQANGIRWRASHIVVTAGGGHGTLAGPLGLDAGAMQMRPLHMVALKHNMDLPLFGHCIGMSDTPLVTITTHAAGDGRSVWYLGGGVAEAGIERDADAQIAAAGSMLAEVLPPDLVPDGEWSAFRVDRAEPRQAGGGRPDGPSATAHGRVIVAWPTKLALAPSLSDLVLDMISDVPPVSDTADREWPWPRPEIAVPSWARPA